ncbi:hypothetical protein DMH12_38345 [Streptomyces sp. WAC 04229]|uniref:hypothetical protein n=1 Tax=Streptomyces sp. WAC 04229 TaxID=2203206 RepID=UPI000F73D96A|nr:hypothetical protein [Streptomyces sp. WAC 04229]RSN35432.1 hypothetical protein DMH12_38345 [Streptomyces sp. WAC 04229]
MVVNVLGLVCWAGGWVALLGISTYTPNWVVWVFMPYFIYGPYRVVTQLKYFPAAFLMLRILRTYPWQVVQGAPHGLTKRPEVTGRQYGWFEFANPAKRDQNLPLVFPRHLRVAWWARRMAPRADARLKADIETVWFAGDPRFIGVLAAPGRKGTAPRRMHVVEQRIDARSGWRFADWGATHDDIERGRRVGVHPVNP